MDQTAFDNTSQPRRRRRRAILAVLLMSSVATLGAGAMSLAVFSDSQAADGSWSTGTVVLGVSPSTTFSASGIMPGDKGSQTVTVANNGTGALRYALTSSTTNADGKGLADQLTLSVDAGTCGSTTGNLYSGSLNGASFGNPAQGADAGDRDLAAASSEDLCFSWAFPLTSGNGYQNAATTATFTFAAEQTANNP